MGRSGKEHAGPSKKAKKTTTPLMLRDEPMPLREEVMMEDIPKWKGGPLTKFHPRFQPSLWEEKMSKMRDRKEAYLVEREVPESLFAHHRVHERFKTLGWQAVLKCYDQEEDKVFAPAIDEWVSTLQMEGTKNSQQMKLVGYCRGHKVTMSMTTLKKLAPFDSLPTSQYAFPAEDNLWNRPDNSPWWELMRDTIFKLGKTSTIKRVDLKKEARLIQTIVTQNVMPRRGDKESVRFCDVPVLYSIMTGDHKMSFCYLAMMNIWLARITKAKQIIPHCRLIQALFKHFKVIDHSTLEMPTTYIIKDLEPFNVVLMARVGWEWSANDRYVRWKHKNGEKIKVKRLDARPLRSSEESEADSEDSEHEDDLNNPYEEEEPVTRPPYPMPDDMWTRVQECIPEGFDMWPNYNQNNWDLQQHSRLQAEDDAQAVIANQNHWNRVNLVHQEIQVNNTWESQQQLGFHEAYHHGEPFVQAPPPVNYLTLPPYDGGERLPRPEWHHSEWIDPVHLQQQQLEVQQFHQQQSGEGSSSGPQGGAFHFSEWMDELNNIFGQRQSRYFGGNR